MLLSRSLPLVCVCESWFSFVPIVHLSLRWINRFARQLLPIPVEASGLDF